MLDDLLVVGRDGGVIAGVEQAFHQLHVVPVHVRLVGVGHGRRLEIRALAEADPGAHRDEPLDVGRGAAKAGLDDHPAVRPVRLEDAVGEEVQGPLGIGGALHVDPHEAADLARPVEDGGDVPEAEFLVDVEAHLGELQRGVDLHPLVGGRKPVEDRDVLVPGRDRVGLPAHALAEEVEGGRDPPGGELVGRRDRLVQLLAGDEPPGEGPGEGVPSREVEDPLLLGEPEEALSDHDGRFPEGADSGGRSAGRGQS